MYSAVDAIWVLFGTVLVFFMQAGFAMLETGFTRAKNAGNIIMKNMMDFSLDTLAFWIIGFGIMFAGSGPIIGGFDFLIQGDYSSTYSKSAFIIFQTVFCATAATIVAGAMAERTKFSAYCIYSIIISVFVYPVSGHWIWGGGWLSELRFHDFAGSTAVNTVGGVAALGGITAGCDEVSPTGTFFIGLIYAFTLFIIMDNVAFHRKNNYMKLLRDTVYLYCFCRHTSPTLTLSKNRGLISNVGYATTLIGNFYYKNKFLLRICPKSSCCHFRIFFLFLTAVQSLTFIMQTKINFRGLNKIQFLNLT